jgi:hypothetical protein
VKASSPLLLSLALAVTGDVSRAEQTSAFRGEVLPELEPTASYKLSAIMDTVNHKVYGRGTLTFTNRGSAALSEVWLHLYLNAFKNDRSVFLRKPAFSGRGQGLPKTWGAIDLKKFSLGDVDLAPRAELHREGDEDETDARIPLPAPVEPGATVAFEMEWEDTLPSVIERTGFEDSFHMVGQWFPKLAVVEPDGTWSHFPFHRFAEFYADFGNYDVTIEAAPSFTVLATGKEVAKDVDGWSTVKHHFIQNGVHDFAFAAWDKGEEARETIDGIDVRFLVPRGATDILEREKETLRFALPHFRERYGPYPYATLSVVHPPDGAEEAGGMEYPTLITTGGNRFTPNFVRSIETVTLHEFGHQYFFGLLASNELASPFLDEGLNSYAEQEALDAWGARGDVGTLFGLRIGETAVQRGFASTSQGDDIVAQPASDFLTGRHYGALVYSQTAQVMETASRVYGKERMQGAMRSYAQAFRFKHPTPKDFFMYMKRELGAEAGDFIETALTTRGTIDYAILGVVSSDATGPSGLFDQPVDGANRKRETKSATHNQDHHGTIAIVRRGELSVPVSVLLEFADGQKQVLSFNAKLGNVNYSSTSKLVRVVVDPEQQITLDTQQRNNVWGESATVPWRSGSWAWFLSQAAMGALP